MDEKERFDANRQALREVSANRDPTPERRADAIARFVGALLYGGRRTGRKRDGRNGKPLPEE